MSNLSAALAYASKGKWKVFPCLVNKHPLKGSNGFYDATLDQDKIKAWWKDDPGYSIGVACGPESGIWVLDVDLPDGPDQVKSWEAEGKILPDTLKQKTGGGGEQYFFKWNGREIRNSSKKIGRGIDVRGVGGYVIVPPSGHESGGKYEWVTRSEPQLAPEWLVDLIDQNKDRSLGNPSDSVTKYGESALTKELAILSRSTEGNRNDNLNSSAYSLGQLVGGGELERGQVEAALLGVAIAIGLKTKEARATINSGINSGILSPRKNPHTEEPYIVDINQGNQSNQNQQDSSKVITGNQEVINQASEVIIGNQLSGEDSQNKPYNLAAHIREWITNSAGSFTNDQIDREFCLKDRKDKMNRAKILSIYKDKKLIRKDKTIKGKWHVIDNQVEWVDLNKADETPFPVRLPFDLHTLVSIPAHGVVVLAGSSNAGKTAFLLNTLRLNMDQSYGKVYLMSEMSDGEYKSRISRFGDPISLWQDKIRAASKSCDFDGIIQHHNPDGLTCIDYLEEIDGEYFKIPSSIRDIYDALGNGVAVIAIQKKTNSTWGAGGEATRQKPRLYITLDLLCVMESEDKRIIFCALKLDKVKVSIKGNMEGKELHFRIDSGAHLSVVMDWTYSSKVNRQKCIKSYLSGTTDDGDDFKYTFQTRDGGVVTLSTKDYEAWKRRFENIDLDKELERISDDSFRRPWLTKKGWFFALGNQLEKLNEK